MLVTDNVILCAQILQESTHEEVKTSVTQQTELAVQKIDPLEEPMRQFSAFLECEFDEKAKKVARFETLRKKAEDKGARESQGADRGVGEAAGERDD